MDEPEPRHLISGQDRECRSIERFDGEDVVHGVVAPACDTEVCLQVLGGDASANDVVEDLPSDARRPRERPEHRGIPGDRGCFFFFEDPVEREAVAFSLHHLRSVVDDGRAVVNAFAVDFDAVLVEGEEDVDRGAGGAGWLLRGPDDRIVVPAPDERGVIEIHVGAVAKAGEKGGNGESRRVDAFSGLSADQYGVFAHGDQNVP